MAIFTNEEFCNKMRWLVNDVPNYYWSENGTWCNYNWQVGKFMMDCVVSIKGILWGFQANPNLPHGGAVYGSNGVADFTPDGGLNYCTDVSTDFTNLVPGEYLCMFETPDDHAGIYLGNGKVFECTCGWGVNRCIISDIDQYGNRSLNGIPNLRWTYHGKLNYIDYSKQPEPPKPEPTKYKVGDVVEINGVYVSSDSEEMLPPAVTIGTITNINEGARNPYLLDDGNIGWVNNNCIVKKIEEEPTDEFKVGDYVVPTILEDYQGNPLTQYDDLYQIIDKDDRGNILGAVRGDERPIWAILPDSNIKKAN